MTTAREAGFIPGDLAVYATRERVGPSDTSGTNLRIGVVRITEINVSGTIKPGTLVTQARLLSSNVSLFDLGTTVVFDAEFRDFFTDADERLRGELKSVNNLPRFGNGRLDLEKLRADALRRNGWHDVQVPDDVIKETLNSEGAIDRLVASGRIPQFQVLHVFEPIGTYPSGTPFVREKEITFCIIPPHGTKHGDQIVRCEGGIYEFFSPLGESRGIANMIELTKAEAAALEEKVDSAKQKVEQAKVANTQVNVEAPSTPIR